MAASQFPSGVCHIAGKVALVTGGASGLGRCVAERFVRNGARVVIADLPSSNGKQVAKGLGGHNALFVPTDVTSDEEVRNVLKCTREKFNRLDIAVNAAAVRGVWRTCDDTAPHDMEAFRRIVDVNLNGTFNVIRLSAALMNENDPDGDYQKGVFINAISEAANEGQAGQAALAAAHGGVSAMTLLLARDLATIGVRIVSIAPEMLEGLTAEEEDAVAPWEDAEDFARLAENIVENPMINGTVIKLKLKKALTKRVETN